MKETKTKAFDLTINVKSALPIYEQIKAAVRLAVVSGGLKEDDQLISVRNLASRHKINPLTILKAYNQLETEGLLYSRRGSGFFVQRRKSTLSAEKDALLNRLFDDFLRNANRLGFSKAEVIRRLRRNPGRNS